MNEWGEAIEKNWGTRTEGGAFSSSRNSKKASRNSLLFFQVSIWRIWGCYNDFKGCVTQGQRVQVPYTHTFVSAGCPGA